MDKRKTKAELLENNVSAFFAYSFIHVACVVYSAAYPDAYGHDLDYWLIEYFELTGESREEYQREADK